MLNKLKKENMKATFFLLLITVTFVNLVSAQTNDFEYSYDDNGNRVLRQLIV